MTEILMMIFIALYFVVIVGTIAALSHVRYRNWKSKKKPKLRIVRDKDE